MQVVKKDIDQLNATLTITIEPIDYEEKVVKELKNIRQKANIPGFRPGMVPASLVKKMYGKAVLGEEVNKAINDGIYKYIQEQQLNILGEPLPNEEATPEIDWDNDTSFSFAFDIAVAPAFDANLSNKDTITYYEIKVDDDMVNKQIESYRSNFGSYVEAEQVEDGDIVKGILTEQKENGIRKEDAILSPRYMADKEQQQLFINAKKGDIVTFNPKKAFGNEAEMASLLGIKKEEANEHTGDFTLEITHITRHELAAVDAELFAKVYGADAVADEEAFRSRIHDDIQKSLTADADYQFGKDAKAAVLKKMEGLAFPDAFLKRWILANNKDLTAEKLDEEYPELLKGLCWDLALDQLLKHYDIKVEKEDIEAFAKDITRMQFMQYGMSNVEDALLTQYANQMLKDEKQLRAIVSRVSENKVYEALKGVVKLKKKSISQEEFNKLLTA